MAKGGLICRGLGGFKGPNPLNPLIVSIFGLKGGLRGQGGSEVDFHFLIVSNRGACQLPGTFFRMKKSCS